jgi:hypothetical protein
MAEIKFRAFSENQTPFAQATEMKLTTKAFYVELPHQIESK